MASDINEQVSNMFNAAKQALNDDLRQNFYNAAINRNTAFRQLNNSANANHALFSGAPAGQQMTYDRDKFLPGLATMATKALAKQQENQEAWDKYMAYIKGLDEQANYYKNLTYSTNKEINEKYKQYAGYSGSQNL